MHASRPAMLVEVLDDAAGARIEALVDGLDYVYLDVDDTAPFGAPALAQRTHIAKGVHLNFLVVSEEQAAALIA